MIAIYPALSNSSLELEMGFRAGVPALNNSAEPGRNVGNWIDEFNDEESRTGSNPLRRKGPYRSKGPLMPAAGAATVRNSHSIQWDRQVPDKSIKQTVLQDWMILK
jgi:hypothetical protein